MPDGSNRQRRPRRPKLVEIPLTFQNGSRLHAVDPSLFVVEDGWPDGYVEEVSLQPTPPKEAFAADDDSPTTWWRNLNDIDPITLEPLSSLPYPPFVLESGSGPSRGSGDRASSSSSLASARSTKRFYFDGEALAEFLISSANFCNPMNRDRLSKTDCERLDAYVEMHVSECMYVAL